VLQCFGYVDAVQVLPSVPYDLRKNWAKVHAEIIAHIEEATTDAERDRALKLLAISPALFLRKPSRKARAGW
jgi:hypothetical protein